MSWATMDARPRASMAALSEADIPTSPGVYALYRHGERVYVGKATSLRARVWNNHSRQGVSMTNSALRRNVAERLGIASSADIKAGRYKPERPEANAVREWLDHCSVAWIECETEAAAVALEDGLKREFKPVLTKR
jgi:hypothetical protein